MFCLLLFQNPIVSSSTVDSVHGLGAQMSGLQISTAGGGAYPALPPGAGQPQHNAAPQYHITAHAPQYTHQTTSGWNVQHLSTPASVIHQVRQYGAYNTCSTSLHLLLEYDYVCTQAHIAMWVNKYHTQPRQV